MMAVCIPGSSVRLTQTRAELAAPAATSSLPLKAHALLWAFRRAETDFSISVYGGSRDCVVSVYTGGFMSAFHIL